MSIRAKTREAKLFALISKVLEEMKEYPAGTRGPKGVKAGKSLRLAYMCHLGHAYHERLGEVCSQPTNTRQCIWVAEFSIHAGVNISVQVKM